MDSERGSDARQWKPELRGDEAGLLDRPLVPGVPDGLRHLHEEGPGKPRLVTVGESSCGQCARCGGSTCGQKARARSGVRTRCGRRNVARTPCGGDERGIDLSIVPTRKTPPLDGTTNELFIAAVTPCEFANGDAKCGQFGQCGHLFNLVAGETSRRATARLVCTLGRTRRRFAWALHVTRRQFASPAETPRRCSTAAVARR